MFSLSKSRPQSYLPPRKVTSHAQEWKQRLISSLPLRYRQHHALYTWGEGEGFTGETWEVESEKESNVVGIEEKSIEMMKKLRTLEEQNVNESNENQMMNCTCISSRENNNRKKAQKTISINNTSKEDQSGRPEWRRGSNYNFSGQKNAPKDKYKQNKQDVKKNRKQVQIMQVEDYIMEDNRDKNRLTKFAFTNQQKRDSIAGRHLGEERSVSSDRINFGRIQASLNSRYSVEIGNIRPYKNKSNLHLERNPSMDDFEMFRSLSDPEISTSESKFKFNGKLRNSPETVFEYLKSSSSSSSFNYRCEETKYVNDQKPFSDNDNLSDWMKPSEEMISLSHIQENMMMHKYSASRGQREREVEWCELIPIQIVVPRRLSR